jgi:hypothetical protein
VSVVQKEIDIESEERCYVVVVVSVELKDVDCQILIEDTSFSRFQVPTLEPSSSTTNPKDEYDGNSYFK